MATSHTSREGTLDHGRSSPRFPSGEFEPITYWLEVTASAVVVSVIYAGVLLSAGLAAAYLAAIIHGITGVIVLITVGPAIIGAAPQLARRVCIGLLDALESYRAA